MKLKLRADVQPKDGFFFLVIGKDDPQAFEKTLEVLKKMRYGDKFNLRLSIPGFSPSPSGSSYRSTGLGVGEVSRQGEQSRGEQEGEE